MLYQLKPSISTFSAMLSAFVGSVINGLSSGWLIAFITGWISWFALFRVLLGAVYMFYRSITGTWEPEYDAITQTEDESHQDYGWNSMILQGDPVPHKNQSKSRFLSVLWPKTSDIRSFKLQASKSTKNVSPWSPLNRDVTFLGWVGWIWTALIAPVSQLIWVAANISNHSNGAVKIVKSLTVAVTALPLSIDSRVRYVRDGGQRRAAQDHWSGYILDVGMGAFAGIFLAAPAFGFYQSSSFDEKYGNFDSLSGSTSNGADGQTLAEYLQCETRVWKKFAAIFP
ncbi:hypothetical protein CJF32_00009071 [Rutstroemia sp. NJR-2017a WRK4]|nr:hypothetical protein CJF32_00009071 [Rutstroemia sp. NJR-2017a WRK4]